VSARKTACGAQQIWCRKVAKPGVCAEKLGFFTNALYKIDLSLLKQHFHQNWDRGFGLCLINVEPGDAIQQYNGFGSGPVSQRLNGGSPETAPSVHKLRMTGAA
jgi:hypothetical protein